MKDPIVATSSFWVRDDAGKAREAAVIFRKPAQEPTGEWRCVYEIRGLDVRPFEQGSTVYGVDSLQALYLTMAFVRSAISCSRAYRRKRVCHEDGKPFLIAHMSLPHHPIPRRPKTPATPRAKRRPRR